MKQYEDSERYFLSLNLSTSAYMTEPSKSWPTDAKKSYRPTLTVTSAINKKHTLIAGNVKTRYQRNLSHQIQIGMN